MNTKRHEMTTKPVLLRLPAMQEVTVRTDLPFGAEDEMRFDLYAPPDARPERPRPVVVFVSGFPDPGMAAFLGCPLKQMQAYQDWARLVAASGLIAVTYSNRGTPAPDLAALLEHLHAHSGTLGIDAERLGLWAASGNVPTALGAVLGTPRPRCAALCYGYLLDQGDATAVAEASGGFGFANPVHGRRVEELPDEVPLLVVRAGGDQTPGLNETLDRFVAAALAHDRPLTLINHSGAPHAFDLEDDRPATREIIGAVLAFLRARLGA